MVKTGGKNHEKVVKNDLNYRKTSLVGINRKNKKKLFSFLSLLIETTLKHIFLDSTALAENCCATSWICWAPAPFPRITDIQPGIKLLIS